MAQSLTSMVALSWPSADCLVAQRLLRVDLGEDLDKGSNDNQRTIVLVTVNKGTVYLKFHFLLLSINQKKTL
jgi:hypothetical protein